MKSAIAAPIFGISRHRLITDGAGITTLVTFHGCPLRCRYCLNDICHESGRNEWLSVYQLYERVRVDELYFRATGGGITFGGGEPALRADFIRSFREVCGPHWHLTLETSLNVSKDSFSPLLDVVDEYIVDIKDMDPDIYQGYTGHCNRNVQDNLRLLVQRNVQDQVVIRIPLIPDFNTSENQQKSIDNLKEMGFSRFDRFNYIIPKHGDRR